MRRFRDQAGRAALIAIAVALAPFACSPPRPAPVPEPPPSETAPPAPSQSELPRALDFVTLAPGLRTVPGAEPATVLLYHNPTARVVRVMGSWNRWQEPAAPAAAAVEGGRWELDTRPLRLPFGRYEFKFLVDGAWENGPNRVLYINERGFVERPSDLILSARIEAAGRIDVLFSRGVRPAESTRVRLLPDTPLARTEWVQASQNRAAGCSVSGGMVTFLMDPQAYDLPLRHVDRVAVAGTFNGWRTSATGTTWTLREEGGARQLTVPLNMVRPHGGDEEVQFKFVINGNLWLPPPAAAPNRADDGRGNTNLRLLPEGAGVLPLLRVYTAAPLALSNAYTVVVEQLTNRAVWAVATPGAALDRFVSSKPLGATLDRPAGRTVYRLFAPRARRVELCLFDGPARPPPGRAFRSLPMRADPADAVWELALPGLQAGQYYGFRVDGPDGPGEAFNFAELIGDPYARAVAHATGNSMVVDPDTTNRWFSGWTDGDWRPPAPEDAVIYETHVRHFSVRPSSRVQPELRGRFAGITATRGLGTGLDHLRAMGVNMLQLMPPAEYENGEDEHQWGYATAFFFAPEASFGRDPRRGSQYWEFKQLVNDLHREGFGVILDVVYNHIGHPNVFYAIDRKYYFRLDGALQLSNFSGCGNDVRTEAPMMRRLIVDNALYWLREFHVDGFRFDLAELIDMQTLREVEAAVHREFPRALLISEPWSSRGDHKERLGGTGWAAWNNIFRDTAKHYALGSGDRERLCRVLEGSTSLWASSPLQSINYLESHDDICLADELTANPGRDGRKITAEDAARHRLAATLLLTSFGIPMIGEGQEFVRSKRGLRNTFDQGDEINALNWQDRERPAAAEVLRYYRGLLALRASPAGESLRRGARDPSGRLLWILPPETRAVGYVIGRADERALVVLVNASDGEVPFDVPFRAGTWLRVGDGQRVSPDGLGTPLALAAPATRRIAVPARTAWLFRSN